MNIYKGWKTRRLFMRSENESNLLKETERFYTLFPNGKENSISQSLVEDLQDGILVIPSHCEAVHLQTLEEFFGEVSTNSSAKHDCDCGAEKARSSHAHWCSSTQSIQD